MDFLVSEHVLFENEKEYPLYKINAPTKPATDFLFSKNVPAYKFESSEPKNIYKYDGKITFELVAKMDKIVAGEWNEIPLEISTLEKEIMIVIVPANVELSTYIWKENKDSRSAYIFKSNQFDIVKTVYKAKKADAPTPADYEYGPNSWANRYGDRRKFFNLGENKVVWQDKTTKAGQITVFTDTQQKTFDFKVDEGFILASAVKGNDGTFYYVLIQDGKNEDKVTPREAYLVHANEKDASTITRKALDTSREKLNIWELSESCLLSFNGEKVALHVTRTMAQSSDGLNHQGAWLAFYDYQTLDFITGWQTASHSFDSSAGLSQANEFINMDLGDAYPRGIKFQVGDEDSLIYTFKTLHGDTPQSPAQVTYPLYDEISTPEKTFYKWSNDNNVYTELASPGWGEVDDGYLFFFLGEKPSLDSSLTGEVLNTPRNVGFKKVSKDLKKILSPGGVEKGGFYTFNGDWENLENEGVSWLTDFKVSANKLKVIKSGDNFLVMFETWSPDFYVNTQFMMVDKNGKVISKPKELCFPMRFLRTDDPNANVIT